MPGRRSLHCSWAFWTTLSSPGHDFQKTAPALQKAEHKFFQTIQKRFFVSALQTLEFDYDMSNSLCPLY